MRGVSGSLSPQLFYTSKEAEKIPQAAELEQAFNQIKPKLLSNREYLIYARQTHSANLSIISNPDIPLPIDNTDGLLTNRKNVWLCVQTADCTPVLLFHEEKHVIGALHAGWRGIAQNISGKAVLEMKRQFKVNASQIHAYIGPCISAKAYEVGIDVYEAFREQGLFLDAIFTPAPKAGKYFCNIKEANRQLLVRAGLNPDYIETDNSCTFLESGKFYSARREGNETGRIISGIILR